MSRIIIYQLSVTHVTCMCTYCLSISKNSDIVSFHTTLDKGFHTFIVDTCLQTQGLMGINWRCVYYGIHFHCRLNCFQIHASIYQLLFWLVMKKKSLKENVHLVSICTLKYSETLTVFNSHFQQSFLENHIWETNENKW